MKGLTNAVATIERLGAYSGDKATIQTVAGSIEGHFTPIDADANTIALKITGQAFQFISDDYQDLRQGDKLTITTLDGTNHGKFGVRGISKYIQKGINFIKCYLEKASV